jgi:hypothetical protein
MPGLFLPLPVKLICGFIYSREASYQEARRLLEQRFGHLDFESQRIDFTFTDYYYPEMGEPLFRKFASFVRLQDPSCLGAIKLYCRKLEKKLALSGKRSVNIDPGYITQAKLVLASTKDFSHRIYLGRGVYAEVTLYFSGKEFREFPTTFPDYRTQTYKDIFQHIRRLYRANLKDEKKYESLDR